jgi:DNA-directed RNA polymerase subunit RPC12/RpoP
VKVKKGEQLKCGACGHRMHYVYGVGHASLDSWLHFVFECAQCGVRTLAKVEAHIKLSGTDVGQLCGGWGKDGGS